jgi:hypothetical protein
VTFFGPSSVGSVPGLYREGPLRLARRRRLQLIGTDGRLLRREGASRQQQHRTNEGELTHRILSNWRVQKDPSCSIDYRDQTWAVWFRGPCANAAFTRSGVNGTSRMRTPVASKIALPTAAATIVMAVLTSTHRLGIRTIDQHAFDARHIRADVQRLVGRPVDRRDLLVVPRHFFAERTRQPLQGAALELVAQTIRARDGTDILRHNNPLCANDPVSWFTSTSAASAT